MGQTVRRCYLSDVLPCCFPLIKPSPLNKLKIKHHKKNHHYPSPRFHWMFLHLNEHGPTAERSCSQSKPMVLHQIFALGYNYDPRGIGYLLFLSLHCNAQLNWNNFTPVLSLTNWCTVLFIFCEGQLPRFWQIIFESNYRQGHMLKKKKAANSIF